MDTKQKARAYDEALKRARILYNDKNEIGYANAESVLEEVFPLLKESEDEKVRKEIISFIKDDINEINIKVSGDYDNRDSEDIKHEEWCKKAIAWLERQATPQMVEDAFLKGCNDTKKSLLKRQGEQKSAWCENDERHLNTTLAYLKDAKEFKKMAEDCIDWLNSLKRRIGG